MSRMLKVIGFFLLGLFVFNFNTDIFSFVLPLGFIVGLVLLKFKSKKDIKPRFVALLIGFLFLIYQPFLFTSFARQFYLNYPSLKKIYPILERMYPNSNIAIQTLDYGTSAMIKLGNTQVKQQKLPTQIAVNLYQSYMLSDNKILQTGSLICKNSNYKIVTVNSVKVFNLLIPIPIFNISKTWTGNC